MKILSNYISRQGYLNPLSSQTSHNNFINRSLSTDVFVRNNISFGNLEPFPFKKYGLKLCCFKKEDADAFINHIKSVTKAHNQKPLPEENISNLREAFLDILFDKSGFIYMIKDSNDKIVATSLLIKYPIDEEDPKYESGFISSVFVDPKWQKKGIATWMVQNLIEKAQKDKCLYITLFATNPVAIDLYKKLGFSIDHEDPKCGLLMFKKLSKQKNQS